MASPWILKRFQVDETGKSGAYVWIEARQPGISGFLLNLIGLDPTAEFRVTKGAMAFRSTSLTGMTQISTSMNQVGGFIGGYSKPLEWLLVALFALIGGGFLDAIIFLELVGIYVPALTLILPLIFVIVYALQKHLFLGFETSGGATYSITFKRGILNNVRVDIKQVENTIALVNGLIGSVALGGAEYTEFQKINSIGNQVTIKNNPVRNMATSPPSNPTSMVVGATATSAHQSRNTITPSYPPQIREISSTSELSASTKSS